MIRCPEKAQELADELKRRISEAVGGRPMPWLRRVAVGSTSSDGYHLQVDVYEMTPQIQSILPSSLGGARVIVDVVGTAGLYR